MSRASSPEATGELAPLSSAQILAKVVERYGQAAYTPWENEEVDAYRQHLHDMEHVKRDILELRCVEEQYDKLLRYVDDVRTRGADADDDDGGSSGSDAFSGADNGISANDDDQYPADVLAAGVLTQLEGLMAELCRRIADPGFYRRRALRSAYDHPPEVLQARLAASARLLDQYLSSLPKVLGDDGVR